MSKVITLADLQNPQPEAAVAPDRGTFKAGNLHCTVCDDDGNEIAEFTMEARAFTPKVPNPPKGQEPDPNAKAIGGVGWYADIKAKEGATYRGLPLSGGFRFSLQGVKIPVGQTVDLSGE